MLVAKLFLFYFISIEKINLFNKNVVTEYNIVCQYIYTLGNVVVTLNVFVIQAFIFWS